MLYSFYSKLLFAYIFSLATYYRLFYTHESVRLVVQSDVIYVYCKYDRKRNRYNQNDVSLLLAWFYSPICFHCYLRINRIKPDFCRTMATDVRRLSIHMHERSRIVPQVSNHTLSFIVSAVCQFSCSQSTTLLLSSLYFH